MISRQDVDELFLKLHKAGWDMGQQHNWGYFFKDASDSKLARLAQVLSELGYEVVDINLSYPDELYWLHVEKTQAHSAQSLHLLNQSFYQLAEQFAVQAYDGMDISPINV